MIKFLFKFIIFPLFAFWLIGYGAFILHVQSLRADTPLVKTDAIVVLTGGGGHRIRAGLNLFASNMSENLFISGVHSSVKKDEITAMWNGITPLPDCCVTLGRKATTTLENSAETKDWAAENDITTLRLVTSYYHMPRAQIEFAHALSNIEVIPHPIHESDFDTGSAKFWRLTLEEYNKVAFRVITRKLGL